MILHLKLKRSSKHWHPNTAEKKTDYLTKEVGTLQTTEEMEKAKKKKKAEDQVAKMQRWMDQ